MVQSNSIAVAVSNAFNINRIFIGIGVAIAAGLILVGGMSRIGSFAEFVVPFMAAIYILGSLIIIIRNGSSILPAFREIFVGAFTPRALGGGFVGITVKEAARFGISRGLFSNEAGMGSTPHAHAVAKVDHPAQQGMVSMVGVVIDTVVICTSTALVNLVTGTHLLGLTGAEMTQKAFQLGLGNFGIYFVAISLLFFAFTTIIGWYFFGEANVKYLFGAKTINLYRIFVLLAIIYGSTLEPGFVWDLADLFNGLMVIPNLIGLLILAPQAVEIIKDYRNRFSKI